MAETACRADFLAESTCSSLLISPNSFTGNVATSPIAYTELSLDCILLFTFIPPFSIVNCPSNKLVFGRIPIPTTTKSAGKWLPSLRLTAVTFLFESNSNDVKTVPFINFTPLAL